MSEYVLSQLNNQKKFESQDVVILNIMTWMPSNSKNRLKCKAFIKNKFCTIYLLTELEPYDHTPRVVCPSM